MSAASDSENAASMVIVVILLALGNMLMAIGSNMRSSEGVTYVAADAWFDMVVDASAVADDYSENRQY